MEIGYVVPRVDAEGVWVRRKPNAGYQPVLEPPNQEQRLTWEELRTLAGQDNREEGCIYEQILVLAEERWQNDQTMTDRLQERA
jgi:hypothetical protein